MGFSDVLWLTVARATVVALLAVGCGAAVAGHVLTLRSGRRRALMVVCLAGVLLTPALVTGYGWAHRELSLIRFAWANEALYTALLSLRWMPLAAAVFYFMPSEAMSRSARQLARMSGARVRRFGDGPERNAALAAGLVFLFAFQEFELASLLVRPAWSVWLFDAQVEGLALGRSLEYGAWGGACELVVLGLCVCVWLRSRGVWEREREVPAMSRWRVAVAWVVTLTAFLGVSVVPAAMILREMLPALAGLMGDFSVGREIAVSVAFALTGVALAMLVAAVSGRVRVGLLLAGLGLLGPLVLALGAQWLFQREWLDGLYDTPVPLLLVLSVLLAPGAVAVRSLVRRVTPSTSLHAARLLGGGDAGQRRWREKLVWTMRGRAWLDFCAILFLVGYFELVASDLLRPTGMTTAPSQLYNLMHYGHNQRLSAMVVAVCAAPVVVYLASWLVVRLSYRVGCAWNERSGA